MTRELRFLPRVRPNDIEDIRRLGKTYADVIGRQLDGDLQHYCRQCRRNIRGTANEIAWHAVSRRHTVTTTMTLRSIWGPWEDVDKACREVSA